MSDESVTWEELRAELIQPEDEPQVAEFRDELIAQQRAYRLAEARRQLGLRQEDVAKAMGVSQARISQIESGVISEVATLAAYVAALGGQLKIVADFGESMMLLDAPRGRRTG
ncbi:helix-turn-helix domain-containing protein [Planobispora longispora]|uniref:Putative antitoxin HigA3 n=1 Tax=Planobispora longispora TaxID=28887 RepID=A0A8J3W979_9ACTN|nr:helix-turn-helix transcriptional regulator [Planobispora longispora]BFE81191.1 XRE family transcriptional regulator [Planobispora longispora]GIH79576.1 putative antitoxin HigA3 [Planobispora longispora]